MLVCTAQARRSGKGPCFQDPKKTSLGAWESTAGQPLSPAQARASCPPHSGRLSLPVQHLPLTTLQVSVSATSRGSTLRSRRSASTEPTARPGRWSESRRLCPGPRRWWGRYLRRARRHECGRFGGQAVLWRRAPLRRSGPSEILHSGDGSHIQSSGWTAALGCTLYPHRVLAVEEGTASQSILLEGGGPVLDEAQGTSVAGPLSPGFASNFVCPEI